MLCLIAHMIRHDEVMQRGLATGAGPNTPHGGELKGKMLTEKSEIDAAVAACNGVTMELNERQLCDVESLCNGSFSPIEVRSARNVANASTGRTMGRTAMQTHVVRLCIDRVS